MVEIVAQLFVSHIKSNVFLYTVSMLAVLREIMWIEEIKGKVNQIFSEKLNTNTAATTYKFSIIYWNIFPPQQSQHFCTLFVFHLTENLIGAKTIFTKKKNDTMPETAVATNYAKLNTLMHSNCEENCFYFLFWLIMFFASYTYIHIYYLNRCFNREEK